MADLSITISNTMKIRNAVVEDAYSLWGAMVWGTDRWFGEFDTAIDYEQWLANGLTVSQAMDKRVGKWLAEGVTLSDAIYRTYGKTFAHTVSLSTTVTQAITQGVWTRQAADVETWTEATPDTETWTEATGASTDWSET